MAEISYFAERFGVPVVVAAALLLGLRPMADGGRPYPAEPVIVGERGPEVFVPDRPGTVLSQAYLAEPTPDEIRARRDAYSNAAKEYNEKIRELARLQEPPRIPIRDEAWDRWLATAPESESIEDRRSEEEKQWTDDYWRRMGWGPDGIVPAPNRPESENIVQFPPAVSQPSQSDLEIQAAKDAAAQRLHNEWSRQREERIKRGDEWLRNLSQRPAGNTSWPGGGW
jgi:hypothetical protein